MKFEIRKAWRDEWRVVRDLNQKLIDEEWENGRDDLVDAVKINLVIEK